MTRKLFVEAARIVSGIRDSEDKATAAFKFAIFFRSNNEKFDPKRFFKACGVNGADHEHEFGTDHKES